MMNGASLQVLDDPNRPLFHFRPPANWMNDPNGTIYHDGFYHLFYQYNPYGDHWHRMHWGHARSTDLVNWEHLPLALTPDTENGEQACWSGCAWIGQDGKVRLYYTAVLSEDDTRDFEQWAAEGSSDLVTWSRIPQNPLLSRRLRNGLGFRGDWRDPFLFRYQDKTYMLVAAANSQADLSQPVIALFSTKGHAALEWDYEGIFYGRDSSELPFMECPNLLEVDGTWLLIYSPFRPVEYAVGELRGSPPAFFPSTVRKLDYSSEFYATNVYVDTESAPVLVGWIRGFKKGQGWNGCLSLPRTLHVDSSGVLHQRPIAALESLRRRRQSFDSVQLSPRSATLFSKLPLTMEMIGTIVRNGADEVRILLFSDNSGAQGIPITVSDFVITVGTVRVPLELAESRQPIDFRLHFDRSTLEIFFLDGRYVVTSVQYTTAGCNALTVSCRGNGASIEKMEIFEIEAVW